ncbi:MAG: cation transporter, partial [Gemmatimonadales bacterium]
MSNLTVPVTGMTCAACSSRIQRTLERTPGVEQASVNLMTNRATVDFDPELVSAESLVAAIRDTGYGAELPGDAEQGHDTGDHLMEHHTGSLGLKLTVSLVAGVLTMVLPMLGLAPDTLRFILLGVTLPVVFWAG